MILALLPAHNEQSTIAAAIRSLQEQTAPPERIVVVADNCTDSTADIARSYRAEVFTPTANTAKKAGALNQALDHLLPDLLDTDLVFVQDADSRVDPKFLAAAMGAFADPAVGAVGGVFYGDQGGGLVGQLQRNEYQRYARDIHRKGGLRVMVLTGTASLFRVATLRQIAAARGGVLPGTRGQVYDTLALTEDNEITVAIKALGWRCNSPAECRVHTEVMPTWGDLWRQRRRWQRGALDNIRHYRLAPVTWRYAGQQLGMAAGVIALWAFVAFTVWSLQCPWHWRPLWLAVNGVFVAERVVTVWPAGVRARAIAATMVVELLYDAFIQMVFVCSFIDMVLGRAGTWHHAERKPPHVRKSHPLRRRVRPHRSAAHGLRGPGHVRGRDHARVRRHGHAQAVSRRGAS